MNVSSFVNETTSTPGESWMKLNERSCQIFSQIKEKLFPVKVNRSAAVKNLLVKLYKNQTEIISSQIFI